MRSSRATPRARTRSCGPTTPAGPGSSASRPTTRRRRRSGSPARSRVWSAAAGRALTRRADESDDAVPGARHRGDVPDERPVPGDRGIVPPLRDPLPARRWDALLLATRGQGRAGLPADPALGHGQRQLRADHQRAGPRDRRQDHRGPARGRGTRGRDDLGRHRGGGSGRAARARAADAQRAGRVRRPRPPAAGRGSGSSASPSCSTRRSRRRATGRCWRTARRTARSAGPTCSSCAR